MPSRPAGERPQPPHPDASVRAASPSPTPLPSVAIPTAKPPVPTRVPDLIAGLSAYFRFYNTERLHQSLGYRTPVSVYTGQELIETP